MCSTAEILLGSRFGYHKGTVAVVKCHELWPIVNAKKSDNADSKAE